LIHLGSTAASTGKYTEANVGGEAERAAAKDSCAAGCHAYESA
jgi:hypothetical protein